MYDIHLQEAGGFVEGHAVRGLVSNDEDGVLRAHTRPLCRAPCRWCHHLQQWVTQHGSTCAMRS